MRAKTEVTANVVVILLAVVVGSVFLKDRLSEGATQSNEVKVGDQLGHLDGWEWSAHDRTLLLVLRTGCHFCEDSIPFYRRVLTQPQQGGSHTAIVAVFPDAADTVKDVVRSEGLLGVTALSGVRLEDLRVSGTPTVLLVDNTGTVLNAWLGVLSPRQELEVIKTLACRGKTCREPA